jgi:hypothetical protein
MGLRLYVIGGCVGIACIWGFAQPGRARNDFLSIQAPCRPSLRATPRLLGPGLRLLRTSRAIGTCPRGVHPSARGVGGTLWATDSVNGLWKSLDDGRSWKLTYTAAAYANVERVLQLRSGHLLIVVADAKGRRHILRSTNSSGTRFGRPVLNFPFNPVTDDPQTAPRLLGSQSWTQSGDSTVYIGEYGFSLRLVHLWKSANDGKSFKVAATFSDIRHIHSVYSDPYSRRKLWVAIGDTGPQPRIGYSIDGGTTFTYVSRGSYPESRAVGLLFTQDAVLWATDSPEVPASLFRWDRASGRVTKVLTGLNGPFYYTAQFHNSYAQFSHVSTKSNDGYIGDEYVHVVTSKNGRNWSSSRTSWRRTSAKPPQKAEIRGITRPDSRGRFWVSFDGLAGRRGERADAVVELQLVSR